MKVPTFEFGTCVFTAQAKGNEYAIPARSEDPQRHLPQITPNGYQNPARFSIYFVRNDFTRAEACHTTSAARSVGL